MAGGSLSFIMKEVVSNYNKEVMSLEYKVLEKRGRLKQHKDNKVVEELVNNL